VATSVRYFLPPAAGNLSYTLPDLGGKWFGTFGGSDELIDQAGMGFRVQESKLS